MILITGGAGYIGSHCCLNLVKSGFDCVVFDNLSVGHLEAVQTPNFFHGDLSNLADLRKVFSLYPINAVIHFASSCYVGESVENPQKYYSNNVANTLNLLQIMLEDSVKKIVFSSSCATYGNPIYTPIDENHPQNPVNPYGRTKLIIGNILSDYDRAYNLKSIALRYFNAAGADTQIGESHCPETHLIPLILKTALGERDSIDIMGNDYETPDGTCIRDYIHVNDLAEAHKLAVTKLINGSNSDVYNLGSAKGYSVKEIISFVEKITQAKINKILVERRLGDPPELFADNKKACQSLNWSPKHSDIENIIKTAWDWEKNKKY